MLKGESSFLCIRNSLLIVLHVSFKLFIPSLIDRTLIVLWRAIVFAAPAGAIIWLICNIQIGSQPIALWLIHGLDPIGIFIGLNGVITLGHTLVAIPANEIVIPTILMLTTMLLGQATAGEARCTGGG